jgi:metallophosphoesterase (TIGR00282 family)
VNLLFIGDIFGKTGRDLVQRALRPLVDRFDITLVIANAENSAGGFGVTRETGEAILKAGVDVMTSGNHVWDKKEALDYIEMEPRLLRPANYPHGVPGCGSLIARTAQGDEVGVLNLMGRVFMTNIDDPFRVAEREIDKIRQRTPIILVDMHAEATSEKLALGWFLDGKVSCVVGTHTHVQTADEQILPQGTAYITDVGMTGPHDGIIGVEREPVINKFLTGLPARFEAASGNPKLHAVVVNVDNDTGRATGIRRVSLTKASIEEMQRGH